MELVSYLFLEIEIIIKSISKDQILDLNQLSTLKNISFSTQNHDLLYKNCIFDFLDYNLKVFFALLNSRM